MSPMQRQDMWSRDEILAQWEQYDPKTLAREVGLKARNLAWVARALDRTLVPDFFVLPAGTCRVILQEDGMPPALQQEVLQHARVLEDAGEFFFVRSSAVGEDAPGSVTMGLFLSQSRQTEATLARAIHECLQHAREPKIKALLGSYPPMALIVQRMVHAVSSGVVFSIHPVTREDTVVVEASYGLGETVVSGRFETDHYELQLDQEEGYEVTRRVVGTKKEHISPETGRITRTPGHLVNTSSLAGETLVQLARLVKRAEAKYHAPVDVEWALDPAGRLWFLQLREVQ